MTTTMMPSITIVRVCDNDETYRSTPMTPPVKPPPLQPPPVLLLRDTPRYVYHTKDYR